MKTSPHLIIPTSSARHFFPAGARMPIPDGAKVVIPTGNKEASYRFPDGEVYLRVPGLKRARSITIVHSGYPDPNGGLIELYMLLDIIAQYSSAKSVEVVFTAMPYARQDKAYYEGELNAARTLIETMTGRYGVRRIATIDAHFANERWTKGLPIENATATPALMDAARRDNPDIAFMAPDAGSTRRVHIKGAKKERENSYSVKVSVAGLSSQLNGRTIGVVDDILATGTTLERFYCEAKRFGAKKVFALITHGVNQSGIQRIQALYDGLYLTDTIGRSEANVPIAACLANLIERSVHEAAH